MTITSWAFARVVVVLVAAVWMLPRARPRLVALLVASLVFYAWGRPSRLAVLAVPIVVDWACALRMAALPDRRARRPWLAISIAADVGLLAWSKLAGSAGAALASTPASGAANVVVAVGVSFITLKSLSYAIDVYRGDVAPCRSLVRYALFVAWFPSIIAGPIVRATEFLPQLARLPRPTVARVYVGAQLVLLGLTKKLVLADQLTTLTNAVFTWPTEFSPATVASGVLAYALQIYCDFSGYTDIALGVSHALGIDLPQNFALPYLATSLTEFWHRWHITLSTWLRDYVYIPLGGNRGGAGRTLRNLSITMLVGGLWHGVAPTFLIWGALHAAGLCVHKLWRASTGNRFRPLGGLGGWLLTFVFVCFAWIFFRAPSVDIAAAILTKLAGRDPRGVAWLYSPFIAVAAVVVVAHVLALWTPRLRPSRPFAARPPAQPWMLPAGGFAAGFVLTTWIVIVLAFAALDTSPFIYVRF